MKKNLKWFATAFGVLVVMAIALMGADCTSTPMPDVQATQQAQNTSANDRLHKANPMKPLNNSQELNNQVQWYTRLSDPNKIAYIYVFNNDGSLAYEYQIRAKCSSTNSMYTTPSEVQAHTSADGGNVVIPAPQPDGSYGANEDAVFCFLNDAGRHMIEFSATWHWLWSEIPLNVEVTPRTIVVIPNGK